MTDFKSAATFAGLRVLDLTTGIPGAYAARLLCDAGAEVTKIEAPGGDPWRRHKASALLGAAPPLPPGEDGAFFRFLNAGKRSAVLDLASSAGQAALLGLAADVDIVVESFEVGWLARRGLGYAELRNRNPALTLVSITPFGQAGPWRDRPATEFTLQAETGSFAARSYDDLGPVAAGGEIGAFAAGSFAAVGAMASWLASRSSGRGSHVDVSMLEAMMLSFTSYACIHGQIVPGDKTPGHVEVPSIEQASDGMVGFSIVTAQQWSDLAKLAGRPDLGDDPALAIGYARYLARDRIAPALREWTSSRTVDELVEAASLMRIPVTPIGNGESVLQMDHLVERRVFPDNPAGFRQPRVPYRLGTDPTATLATALAPAPRLGEHTADVLREASASPSGRPTSAPRAPARVAPLEGLRVADFSTFWAGPIATSLLGALGADVIKVESIQRPDGMRFASGYVPEDGDVWDWAPVFHGANNNKRAITLNLESDRGLELARELVKGADVVIENFSPRVMERFGLDFDGVHALNPQAIAVRMPAFGLEGPWRDRVGFAMTIEQASGLAWRTGFPERGPVVPRGTCDPLGGMHAVLAILIALERRRNGEGGQSIEVALAEVGMTMAAEQVIEWTAYGQVLGPEGNRGPTAAPQGVYATGDGEWIAIAVASDDQWRALAAFADSDGALGWSTDRALDTAAGRRSRHDELDAALAAVARERDAEPFADALADAGVPAAFLRNLRTVVPGHPQLDAVGFLHFHEHPAVGRMGYPTFPFRFDGERLPLEGPAPRLGQHNEDVLVNLLGVKSQEIEELRKAKVIGKRPSFAD